MSIKVFATNNLGKIEFDRASLEKLLNEIYEEGYRAGEKHAKGNYWTWCPSITTTTPYYYNTTSDTTAISTSLKDNSYTTATTATTVDNSNKITNASVSEKVSNNSEPKINITLNGKPVEYSNAKELLSDIEESFNKIFGTSKKADTAFTTLAKEIANL